MSDYFSAKVIADTYDVTVPARYKKFLETERKALTGSRAEIPSYGSPIAVHFDGPALESFINEDWPEDDPAYGHPSATEFDFGEHPGVVPFATLGSEEAQFLVIDLTQPRLPISMWEHETGELESVSDSLDAFLAELAPAKPKVVAAKAAPAPKKKAAAKTKAGAKKQASKR